MLPPPLPPPLWVAAFAALLLALAARPATAQAQYSKAWGVNGELWRPTGRLSDWSYAGGLQPLLQRRHLPPAAAGGGKHRIHAANPCAPLPRSRSHATPPAAALQAPTLPVS